MGYVFCNVPIQYFLFVLKMRLRSFWKDNSGMGTIEVVIIIAILVALALIFRNFIVELANDIFGKIESNASSAISDL